jgi:hypothetical protein
MPSCAAFGVHMKSMLASIVIASLSFTVTGAMTGCHASADVEPNHTSSVNGSSSSSYKKTEVRDANGNLVEKKVESHSGN